MPAPKKVYTEVLEKLPRKQFEGNNIPKKARSTPTNDYLKYYRPLRRYYQLKYKLTLDDFEMLFFLYSEKYFTMDKFEEFENILFWNKYRLDNLVRDGWVSAFSSHQSNKKKIYELSVKGKRFCFNFYQVLNGKEVPMCSRSNPLMGHGGKDGTYKKGLRFSEKVLRLFLLDINKAYRAAKKTGVEDLPYD